MLTVCLLSLPCILTPMGFSAVESKWSLFSGLVQFVFIWWEHRNRCTLNYQSKKTKTRMVWRTGAVLRVRKHTDQNTTKRNKSHTVKMNHGQMWSCEALQFSIWIWLMMYIQYVYDKVYLKQFIFIMKYWLMTLTDLIILFYYVKKNVFM